VVRFAHTSCPYSLGRFVPRVAPGLPPLIPPLPTLRRTRPAAGPGRLRRNNNWLSDWNYANGVGGLPTPNATDPNLAPRASRCASGCRQPTPRHSYSGLSGCSQHRALTKCCADLWHGAHKRLLSDEDRPSDLPVPVRWRGGFPGADRRAPVAGGLPFLFPDHRGTRTAPLRNHRARREGGGAVGRDHASARQARRTPRHRRPSSRQDAGTHCQGGQTSRRRNIARTGTDTDYRSRGR